MHNNNNNNNNNDGGGGSGGDNDSRLSIGGMGPLFFTWRPLNP